MPELQAGVVPYMHLVDVTCSEIPALAASVLKGSAELIDEGRTSRKHAICDVRGCEVARCSELKLVNPSVLWVYRTNTSWSCG